jgi:hypothetical protein
MGRKLKVVDIVAENTNNEASTPETVSTEQVHEVTPDVEPEQVPVNDTPPVETVNEEPPVEVIQKPKAKPRSKKKQTVETVEVPTPEVEPAKPEVEVSDKVTKVVEQVKCKKCDKTMTPKALRYTHEQNCKGKVVKTEEQPVKRRTKKEEPSRDITNKKEVYQEIIKKNSNIDSSEVEIPEHIKLEVLKSIQRQQTRLKMKEDNLNRLKMQIA